MSFFHRALASAAVALIFPAQGFAQDLPAPAIPQSYDPPAHIAFVDGAATLDRENESEPAAAGTPLVPGDRLRTARGRVEILFPDGTALDLDEFTTIELRSPTLLTLDEGRLHLIVAGAAAPQDAANFHVDTPVAGIDTFGPGEYRMALMPGRVGVEAELAVVRGSAALTGDRGSMPLRAGERSTAFAGGAPSYPLVLNAARFDAFDRWVDARRDDRRGALSSQYLPPDLRTYGTAFDRDGSWAYESQYGYVWYPNVAADWRPYYDGYWSSVPVYGWTWVGGPRWTWPTHHYGRWGHKGHRWYWIPDRHWGPAWVSWGAAPGYVGWCPLGFNNRPVFGLSVSVGSHWNGWVAVPREHFGVYRQPVKHWAARPGAFSSRTHFVAQSTPPVPPRAVARGASGRNASAFSAARPAPGRVWSTQDNGITAGRRPQPQAPERAGTASTSIAGPRASSAARAGSITDSSRQSPSGTPRFGTRARSPYGVAVPRAPQGPSAPTSRAGSRAGEAAPSAATPARSAAPNTLPETVPVYRGRRPQPQSSQPAAPAQPSRPDTPSARFGDAAGGRDRAAAPLPSPPESSGGGSIGRAVPRARPAAGGPSSSGGGDGQGQAAQPRGSRRAR